MKTKNNIVNIGIAVIILLLLLNAYLLWNKSVQDKKIALQSTENAELLMTQAEVEKNYYEAMNELEGLKTNNDSLNILIEQQQNELANQRHKLIRSSEGQKELKSSISEMRKQNDQFIARINRLVSENEDLSYALQSTRDERDQLNVKYEDEKVKSGHLENELVVSKTEKVKLEQDKNILKQRINAASVIQANKVSVSGLKIRGGGKEVERNRSSNVDKLEVCFETQKNFSAKKGKEVFHLRLLDPSGQTIAVESMGSGLITDKATGEQMRFTRAMTVDYNQDVKDRCIEWTPQNGVSSGRYQAFIYNKGYLAGEGSVEFK